MTMAGSPTPLGHDRRHGGQREHAPGDEDLRRQGGGQHRAEFAPRAHERAPHQNEAERPASTVQDVAVDIGCGRRWRERPPRRRSRAVPPQRPSGMCSSTKRCTPGSRVIAALVSVAKKPGAMPLTSTPWGGEFHRHGPRQRREPAFRSRIGGVVGACARAGDRTDIDDPSLCPAPSWPGRAPG